MDRTEADFEALVNAADEDELLNAYGIYHAYREAVGGIAYNGEKIPEWPNIKWRARWGWLNAYREADNLLMGQYPF